MFFKTHLATVKAHLPLIVRVLIIGGVALLLRMSAWYYNAVTDSGEYLFQDSSSYYRTAVHLANGHGYVLNQGEEPHFFREPATSYFYAGSVALYQALTGRPVVDPSYDENNWPKDLDNRNVIRLIRWCQAILHAIALVLFYLLLRHYFRDGFAFAVAALASLYPPLALYSEQLMRENLLLPVFMVITTMLCSHLRRPAYWKLAVIGVLWGISALTLQVYALLGAFLLAFILLRTRNAALAWRRCAVVGACFVLAVLPWLHKVYTFYPDVRIARSMGCALTPDWIQFKTALQFAKSHPRAASGAGDILPGEVLSLDAYGYGSRELFDKAFNGYFRQTARRLDATYGRPSAMERARTYVGALALFGVLPGYQYGDWSASRRVAAHDHGNMVVTMFMSFVMSVCSVFGLWACFKKASDVLPVYLFHLAFFWILMSESRRAIPIVPFFLLFGIVGLWKVVQSGFPRYRSSIWKES